MKNRLIQFLELEQLSPARFADVLGVQRSGVSHILSGRNKPGFDFIEKILTRFPGINAEWLITGKGKMYKEVYTPTPPPDLFSSPPIAPIVPETPAVQATSVALPSSDSNLPNQVKEPESGSISGSRKISKIVIFYSDKHFSEYLPE